jgi:hypothetical protein
MKVIIDTNKCIAEMEESKYKVADSAYAKGCNDVIDYYINKLKGIVEDARRHRGELHG